MPVFIGQTNYYFSPGLKTIDVNNSEVTLFELVGKKRSEKLTETNKERRSSLFLSFIYVFLGTQLGYGVLFLITSSHFFFLLIISHQFSSIHFQGGWIPAGGDIRTERVVGDMLTVLTSPEVEIVSELGKIMFNCSVTCNLTGVAPKGTPGEHLSKINDCNLIFRVFRNEVLSEEVNCSYPRGGYQYRHEKNRDGRIMKHILPLEKGRYSFR